MRFEGSAKVRCQCTKCGKLSPPGRATLAEDEGFHVYILQGALKDWEIEDEAEFYEDTAGLPIAFGLCPECRRP